MKAIVHTLLKTFDGTDLTICMRGYPQIFFMFPLQPSYPFYSLMKCYLAALGSKTLTQLQSMHIHVVGEACAGKSETIRRLQEAQKQTIFSSFKTSSPTLISLEEGRTRGIESTILVSERQATNFVVHDYGGQEELKINHADSLHRDGSVYVIVLPMWNMLRKSAYSNDEISKQLLKWLRYLYSMYSKVESATHTDVTKQKATFDQKHGGIPVIIVLNKFSKYQRHVTDDHCDTLYRNLVLDVKRYFAVGEFGEHCLQASTFDFILMQTSSVAIDGIIASKVRKLQDSMEMLCTALVTTSQFSMPAIVSYVIEAYDRVKSFNMLESMETMEKEIKNMISHYSGFAALTEIDIKCLSEVFLAPCLDALVYKNKLILMKRKKHIGMSRESVETVVVTRPSMLTSRVVGEILFHFVGSERDEDKHSSASISHYILNDTELLHILTSRRSTTDAHDMNEMRNLFTTKHKDAATEIGLSISDLLIRMQLAVPYCKQTKMVVTEEKRDSVLLLGLFPGKMDKSLLPTYPSSSSSSSNSDDTPLTFLGNVLQTATQTKPYILSRVFCLPNNKYCFLPGYFMRLFLFVYDLYKHDAEIDFWKNGMQVRPRPSSSSSTAAKSQSTAIYIRAGKFQVGKEHSLHGFILHICDEEGQMNNNVLDQLYKIRTFLQTNMWGLQVREYCIVNEDYLQTQRYKLQHVDEVEQALLVHGKLSSEDYYSSGSTEEHRKLRNLSMYFGDIFPHLSIGDTFSVISKWKITVNAYRVEGDVVYLDIGHQHTADLKATIGSLESVLQQFLANQHVEIVMLRRYVLELLRLGKYPTMSLAEVDEMIQKMIPKDSTAVISDVARLLTNSSNAALLSRSIENELSIYNYPLIYMVEKVSNVASVNCPVGYCFKKLDLRYLLHDVYRVRFLCQHCGQYPKHDSGYEITVMPSKWKTFLTALHYSLCVTEFMLKVGGVPNGISQISKLALGSVDILDEKNQAFLQDTALQVNKLKESLEGLLEDYKIEEAEVKKPPTTLLKKTYSITGSHINEVAKLFQDVLGDTSVQKENTGLIYMTSNEDSGNKRAWVCKGENRCEKWFRETGKICVEYEYGYK